MSSREMIEALRAADTRVLFNRREAAAFFKRSISWFAKVAKDEKLPSIRVGRSPMFAKNTLYDELIRMDEGVMSGTVLFLVQGKK